MREWGVFISIIYGLMVLGLLTPLAVLLVGPWDWWGGFWKGIVATYREWIVWALIVIVLGGQALLLFLSTPPRSGSSRARTFSSLVSREQFSPPFLLSR